MKKYIYIILVVICFNVNIALAYSQGYSNLFTSVDGFLPGNTFKNTKTQQQDKSANYGISGGYLYSLTDKTRLGGGISFINGSSFTISGFDKARLSYAFNAYLTAEHDFYSGKKNFFFGYVNLGYSVKSISYVENTLPEINPDVGLYLWSATGSAAVADAQTNSNYCAELLFNNPNILTQDPTNQIMQNINNINLIQMVEPIIDSTATTPIVSCSGFIVGYKYDADDKKYINYYGSKDKEKFLINSFFKPKDLSASNFMYSIGLGYRTYLTTNTNLIIKAGYYVNLVSKPNSYSKIYNNSLQASLGFTYNFY